jgi:hypothetical protein
MAHPSTILVRRFAGLAAALVASAALVGAPAAAGTTMRPASRAAAWPAHHASRPVPAAVARGIAASSSADLAAAARAKATGKPVVVASKTTETSQTIARPDGTLVTTTHVLPVRVRVHGAWRPVSAALRRVPGGWAPAALPSGVLLSPGGAGPLAVLTSAAGATLAIRFPARLPAPEVSGPAAVYRSVLPGVDLRVTATDPGGIAVTLVVRDASAAASPLLRRLRLALAAAHLSARAAGSGTAFTDPAGVTEYSAPPPAMWDSRHARPARVGQRASTAAFPGAGAHTAPVRAALVPGGITLAPDPALLTAQTRYPVYIAAAVTARQLTAAPARPRTGQMTAADNTFNNTVKSTKQYAGEVKSACPNTAGLQGSSWQGVGYQDYSPDCNGLYSKYRAIYRFDVSGLDPGMVIEQAKLEAWVQYGADFTCSHTWPVAAHWVTKIDSSTTWNSLGTHTGDPALKDDVKPGPNPNSTCTVQSPTWTITDAVATAAANSYTDMSWSFWGDECTSCSANYGYMGLGNNPDIQTRYDRVPDVPKYPCASSTDCSHTCTSTTNCAESPSPQDNPGGTAFDDGCNISGSYGWINQSSAHLQVDVAPAIANEDVYAHFIMTDDKNGGSQVPIGHPNPVDPNSTGYSDKFTGGGETFTPIDITLADGHSYSWQAQAWVNGDGTDLNSGYNNANAANVSAWTSPKCHFNVDLTAPSRPSVASTTFPAAGGTTSNGNPGTFTFSSADSVPAGCTPSPCLASGVYGYIYSLNGATPVTTTASSATLTIGDWGTNILQVQAQDNAGNISRPAYYTFYVPWNSGIQPHPGDIDGDGTPDLLAITSGALNMYDNPAATTNGLSAPTNASAGNASPDATDGADWSTFHITHRGSVTQQGSYDDLWALGGSHHTLYLYQNNPPSRGAAPQYGNTAWVNPVTYPTCGTCANYPAGWSSYTQILSPGDAWAGDPASGVPSLLAVDSNGRLWAFQGLNGNALAVGITLGTGWGGMTLIAPGQLDGHLQIWARDNTTGALYSYVITLDTNGNPTLSPGGSCPAPVTPEGCAATLIPGITLTQAAYPVIASAGDNSTGTPPALYAIDTSGNVWAWPGTAGTASGTIPPPPLTTTPVKIGTVPAGSVTQLS